MEQNNVYTSYGECRCCLAKGHHRDVTKEYYSHNIREVYLEIFMECFNLTLTTHRHISPLICSTCVQRLRDATSFRMMVASTERQLLKALGVGSKGTHLRDVLEESSNNEDIKIELKVENDDQDSDSLHPEQFDDDEEYYCVSSKFEEKYLLPGEAALLSRFPDAPPLPTRCSLSNICPEYVEHLNNLKDTTVKAETLQKFLNAPKTTEIISEKIALAINATAILENSNAVAFQTKSRNGYPCFYCRQIFINHNKLRKHQLQHPKTSLFKLLTKKFSADCLVVYAEVTDLKCTICNKDISNLNELKTHLVNVHKKKMYLEYSDRVIPYNLGNFECQVCRLGFETFGAVERHMNKHYGNFMCEECGAGFVTKQRLGAHSSMQHKEGNYTCETCKKTFSTQSTFRFHIDSVHRNLKKNKCPQCPERFLDYFTRQKHLYDVHKVKPILYKCKVCEKAFSRRYGLSLHVKRSHLEERNVKCQICGYTCFTNNELNNHSVVHGGVKEFECEICRKTFARKKTLVQHMRIHANDRRYACNVCGLAFVQKCSLKGHMKTHQDI